MKTGNELKKEIRNANPELKHNDLSVKTNDGSYYITLKKFCQKSKVDAVTSKYISIARCESSGEILSGCNVFVFVSFDSWRDIEVPSEVINQVENKLGDFEHDEWKNKNLHSLYCKSSSLVYAIQRECAYFKKWIDFDIESVLPIIAKKSPRLTAWLAY